MFLFRTFLKTILGLLSRIAISKHRIKLIVVSGWYGTDITRELIYTIVDHSFKVRRVTSGPWWDFSIPLAILGYKDRRRNFFEWIWLINKAALYLLIGPSNPHTLILQAECSDEATAKFWSGFIKPDYLLVINYQQKSKLLKKLIASTKANQGRIIYNSDQIKENVLNSFKNYENTFSYGLNKNNKLQYEIDKANLTISYQKLAKNLLKNIFPGVAPELLVGAFATALSLGISLEDAIYFSFKFTISDNIFKKISTNLSLHTN